MEPHDLTEEQWEKGNEEYERRAKFPLLVLELLAKIEAHLAAIASRQGGN